MNPRPLLLDRISPKKIAELWPRLLADWDRLASRVTIAEVETRKYIRQLQRAYARGHQATLRADAAERALWAGTSRPTEAARLLARAEKLLRELAEGRCPSCQCKGLHHQRCRLARWLDSLAAWETRDWIRGSCSGCGRSEPMMHADNCPLRQAIQRELPF